MLFRSECFEHCAFIICEILDSFVLRSCKSFDFFIREVNQRLDHLVVDLLVRQILLFIIGLAELAMVFLKSFFILVEIFVIAPEFELTCGQNDLNVFLNEIMLDSPSVRQYRFHMVYFTKLHKIKAAQKSFDISRPDHEVLFGHTWQHHTCAVRMFDFDCKDTNFFGVVGLDVHHSVRDFTFPVLNDNNPIDIKLRPWIRRRHRKSFVSKKLGHVDAALSIDDLPSKTAFDSRPDLLHHSVRYKNRFVGSQLACAGRKEMVQPVFYRAVRKKDGHDKTVINKLFEHVDGFPF